MDATDELLEVLTELDLMVTHVCPGADCEICGGMDAYGRNLLERCRVEIARRALTGTLYGAGDADGRGN